MGKKRNILAIGGIAGMALGVAILIPATINNQILIATLAAMLMVAGIIVFGVSMGD